MSTPFEISIGCGATNAKPTNYTVQSFADLAQRVVQMGDDAAAVKVPTVRGPTDELLLKKWKGTAPLWWMAQPFAGDGSRKAVNAQPWPLLLLDIDRVSAPDGDHMGLMQRFLVVLRGLVPCFGWSTVSHTHEAPAFRVVIGLSAPVTNKEGALLRDALMPALADRLGLSVGQHEGANIYVDPRQQSEGQIAFLPVGERVVLALHEAVAPLPVGDWLAYARGLKAQEGGQQPALAAHKNAPSPHKTIPQTPEMVEEVTATLRQLDQHCPTCVHDRPNWLKVLMSLKAFGWDDAVMEPIAREWSQQSPKFDGDSWQRDWYSIKPRGAITPATLYYLAGVPRGEEADLSVFTVGVGAAAPQNGEHSAVYALAQGAEALPLGSDDGAAQALIAWLGGTAMYTRDAWHVFDGCRWRRDTGGMVMAGKLKSFAHALFAEARQRMLEATRAGDKHMEEHWDDRRGTAAGLLKEKRQVDVLSSASKTLYRADAALDGAHDLLCVPNGAVDLRTGELLPPSSSHMFSLVAGVEYDPEAKCPRFERFIGEVLPNGNLREYMQRFLGYCLTGRMSEEIMGVWVGTGANGKSVLGDVVANVLGEFACAVDPSLLTGRAPSRGQASPEAAKLMGKRLAYANESREGDRLNDGTVKQLVSTERTEARQLYGNIFEFYPTAKIVLRTNHKPDVRDDSDGFWRRLQLVSFLMSFKGKEDPHLSSTLHAELVGILAWCVRGAMEWYRIGLKPPKEVIEASEGYRQESDVVGEWLRECTVQTPGRTTPTAELFQSFEREMGKGLRTARGFGRALVDRGVTKADTSKARGFALTLKLGLNGEVAPDPTQFGLGGAAQVNPFANAPAGGAAQVNHFAHLQ